MTRRAAALERDAEQLAALVPPLLVAAERLAATVAQGIHGRRRVGPGEAFWQFRRYQPGDPVGAIDWRQSAKSVPVFIREREWAAAQSAHLWCDVSASMSWRSRAELPEKRERAMLLVLALATLLLRGGERVALLGDAWPPASGRVVLQRLAATLAGLGGGPSLPPTGPLTRHGEVVLFGDFLGPVDALAGVVRVMAGQGVRGHLVQILDPAEEAFPYDGRIRFAGVEGEGELLASRAEEMRDAYVARLAEHRRALADLVRGFGWTLLVHHCDQPPQPTLLALHAALAER